MGYYTSVAALLQPELKAISVDNMTGRLLRQG